MIYNDLNSKKKKNLIYFKKFQKKYNKLTNIYNSYEEYTYFP